MTSVTQTHFLLYIITNKINGKRYIGCHKTKDPNDSYMGSGKYLKHAQNKYGIENFNKEILFDFDNSEDMFTKEKELIASIDPEYNLHGGGCGGWDYINSHGLAVPISEQNRRTGARARSSRQARKDRILEYNKNPKRCALCDSALSYDSKNNTFCSHKCSIITSNRKRKDSNWVMPDSSRKKIAQSLAKTMGYVYRKCSCGVKIKPNNVSGMCGECYRKSKIPAIATQKNRIIWGEQLMSRSARSIAREYGTSHAIVLKYAKQN